jgi:hypothetical protein
VCKYIFRKIISSCLFRILNFIFYFLEIIFNSSTFKLNSAQFPLTLKFMLMSHKSHMQSQRSSSVVKWNECHKLKRTRAFFDMLTLLNVWIYTKTHLLIARSRLLPHSHSHSHTRKQHIYDIHEYLLLNRPWQKKERACIHTINRIKSVLLSAEAFLYFFIVVNLFDCVFLAIIKKIDHKCPCNSFLSITCVTIDSHTHTQAYIQ